MTLEEFTQIIDSHGSEPARWPEGLRQQCENFLANSVAASVLIRQQQEVEMLMDQIELPAFPGLEARVLTQPLPPHRNSALDQFLAWLLPPDNLGKHFWRPAMAACLPLVFGTVIANFYSFGVNVQSEGFEYWDDELYMLSLNDYTENQF
jgi:hypothetical protein